MDQELITWEECGAISSKMIADAADFEDNMLDTLSRMQGLYFMCYTGTELGGTLWKKPEPAVIYIGRAGKDSVRHWYSNTSISTVRRSLAAMLANSLMLTAIPGSEGEDEADRFTNYALEAESEEKLSIWMKSNIKMAFLELPEEKIDPTYRALINYNSPKLNFQDNPSNTFGQQIKAYRKLLIDMAAAYDPTDK